MSRSGYTDDIDDNWALIKWRGQVASAIRGKRGQAFLREMIDALDALPEKRLISYDLEAGGSVCAIGSVGLKRGVDMAKLDPEDPQGIAHAFGIAHQLVSEIEFMNDEAVYYGETPEHRWGRMRRWAISNLASGILTEGGDVKQAPGESLSSPVPNGETPITSENQDG
jgi:hypothetical protein